MQFSIGAKELVAALGKAKGATETRNVMPILGSVVIEARAGSVLFTATDLKVGVEAVDSSAIVQEHGAVVIPLDKLLKLARKLKGSVSFESAYDNGVTVRCAERGSKTTLAGSPRGDYPTLPEAPEKQVEVDAEPLRAALATVLHAASKDESRYNLNGVYIDADTHPTARVVATDGHRLALADMGPMSLPWKGGIIVPRKGIELLVKFLKGADAVMVAAETKSLRVSDASGSVSIRLIEGEFPSYQQVIPKRIGETVTADAKQFRAALATAVELAPELSRAVRLVFNEGIELQTSNPDLGDSVVVCPCERSGTDEIKVAFNGRYLIEAIAAVCTDRVAFGLAASGSDMVPVCISGSETVPCAVVMPMRL